LGKNPIHWMSWEKPAFDRAREQGRPVFVLAAPAWVSGGPEGARSLLEEGCLGDLIESRFVPVAVDPQRVPLLEGYGLRQFPSALVLDADGAPMARLGSLDAHFLRDALPGIALGAGSAGRAASDPMGRVSVPFIPESDGDLERGLEALEDIRDRVRSALRSEAFELEPSQAKIEALRFLIRYSTYRSEREDMERAVEQLHSLAHSPFYDGVEGGFFGEMRAGGPATHKLLRHNADWLILALRICRLPGAEFALPLARGIFHYLQHRLQRPGGGFAASQREDAAYYALSGEERRRISPPPADPIFYTAPNAMAARAFCKGWRFLGEVAYLDQALVTHEALSACVEGGDGSLAHAFDGTPAGAGTLEDAVELGQAYLGLYHATLEPRFLEGLRRAAGRVAGDYRNPAGEGFLDLPLSARIPGLPFRPVADASQNARACTFLMLASAQLGEESLASSARRTIGALLASPPEDLTALSLLGDALLAALYPMAVLEVITDGSREQRFQVLERLREMAPLHAVITHRGPAPREGMQRLPRVVSHCGGKRTEVVV
jgi:uncharacterized protein YyaL (SSP411 family)